MRESIDKSQWPDGPWMKESDYERWTDADSGLECMIRRHRLFGHLCGYVGVGPGHPWYEKHYDHQVPIDRAFEERTYDPVRTPPIALFTQALCANGHVRLELYLDVHGGLTFSERWEDEPDGLWWFGFDCNHCDDYGPGIEAMTEALPRLLSEGSYRPWEYVVAETKGLARQLAEARDEEGKR